MLDGFTHKFIIDEIEFIGGNIMNKPHKYQPKELSQLDRLRQKKQDILKLILHEANQLTRNIYKSQIINIDTEIIKAEIKENRCNDCKTRRCGYCKSN